MSDKIHILFDGPPSHVSGRFVEVENDEGASISVGEWKERPDGLWELVIDTAGEERDRYKADSEALDWLINLMLRWRKSFLDRYILAVRDCPEHLRKRLEGKK